MEERARLVGERVGNRRVGVTERGDREAAEEVEVLLALAVPEAHALAANERDRLATVRLHHMFGVERDDVVERRHIELSIPLLPGQFRFDHGADALTGEELEQQRVRGAAIEDVGAPHAVVHRVDTRPDLGDHPLRQLARRPRAP